MVDTHAPVEISWRDKWGVGLAVDMNENFFSFEMESGESPEAGFDGDVIAFFKFRGTRMTGRGKFISIEKRDETRKLKIGVPKTLYRDLSRGYERVAPQEGDRVCFMVKGEKFALNFPQSKAYEPFEEPQPAANVDPARMTTLLKQFRESAQAFSSESKIVMFRERQPENFEENLVTTTGKTFLYPQSLHKATLENTRIISPRVLAQEEVILHETNRGRELFQALNFLSEITKDKEAKNILQEMYSPILYNNYAVGYLYLVTFKNNGRYFPQKVMDFVFQFGRLLVHSLKVNGYFKGVPVQERVEAEIIDISASGIQMVLPRVHYDKAMELLHDLTFTLYLRGAEMQIGGRIMRKFRDKGRLYVCTTFVDIQDPDRLFLMESLYGSSEAPDLYPAQEDWSV
jgi:hypothetical protein